MNQLQIEKIDQTIRILKTWYEGALVERKKNPFGSEAESLKNQAVNYRTLILNLEEVLKQEFIYITYSLSENGLNQILTDLQKSGYKEAFLLDSKPYTVTLRRKI